MRKLLLSVVLLLLAVMSVSAIGETELSALARYVPEDALGYAAIRTDDDFIASINALINKGLPYLPADEVPSELDLMALLNTGLEEAGLGSFEESIRPWLGDTAAIALFAPTDIFSEAEVLVMLEADGESAYEFLEPLLAENPDYGAIEINNMRGFESKNEGEPVTIAFGDDTIFFSNNSQRIPTGLAESALSSDAKFNSSLSSLPADEYVAVIYVNNAAVQALSIAQSGTNLPSFLQDFLQLSPSIAVGFTMLNDEALVMDMAQSMDLSILENAGLSYASPSALDMGFTNHIPADAIAVLQGSDFGAGMQLSFDNIRALGEYIKANGGLADLLDPTGTEFDTEAERHAVNQFDLAWLVGALNVSFAGATGLSLENEVFPVLDGDAAVYLRVLPVDDFFIPVIPDAAILFQSSNADGAEAIVNQLSSAATAYETVNETESFGNGTALVFPAEEMIGIPYSPLDLMIGASDDVFALGTRGAVEASIAGGANLADDATFQAATQYILSDSQNIAYLAPTPLFNVLDPLIVDGTVPMDSDTENAYRLLSLVESATISGVVQSDGTSMVRFVITLSDAPRPVPQGPDA